MFPPDALELRPVPIRGCRAGEYVSRTRTILALRQALLQFDGVAEGLRRPGRGRFSAQV
jgi:hypothetical protein